MGRNYVDCVTISPLVGVGSVSIYSVATDPNGVLGANAGDFAYQVGTANRWSCTGGSVWICVGNASSGTVPAGSVIWRPGGVEDVALGIYTTWATAYAAARAIADATVRETGIIIDISILPSTIVSVPAGTWNMTNIRLLGDWTQFRAADTVEVETAVGCVFTGFNYGFAYITLRHLDPAVPLYTIPADQVDANTIGLQVGPESVAYGLVWATAGLPDGGVYTLRMLEKTKIGGEANNITLTDFDSFTILLYPGSSIAQDSVAGTVDSDLTVTVLGNWVKTIQTNMLGSYMVSHQLVPSLAGAAPGFGVTQIAGSVSNSIGRTVFGTITLAATAGNMAQVTVSIETGLGTGVFSTVLSMTQVATDTVAKKYNFSFPVPAGFSYRFNKGSLAGVTETISLYSYIEQRL
jgi:hypothetical protein